MAVRELTERIRSEEVQPSELLEEFLDYAVSLRRETVVRTPGELARTLVEAMELQKLKRQGEKMELLDPACGSGAFLRAALRQLKKGGIDTAALTGMESDRALVTACSLSRILMTDRLQITHTPPYPELKPDTYDVILANPPFGKGLKRDSVEENRWNPGDADPYRRFIYGILRALRPGGSCCVTVPDSFLYAVQREAGELRRYLLENYSLEGVVKLPPGMFLPQTGVQASALLLKRPAVLGSGPSTGTVCFYEMQERETCCQEFLQDWKQRAAYQAEWEAELRDGNVVENLKGILIPVRRKRSNMAFITLEQIAQMDYSLAHSNFRLDEAIRLSDEEPAGLLAGLMKLEEEFTALLKEIAQESGIDV